MLSRGFQDALLLWPAAAWPIIASSLFWAFIQLCRTTERRYGFSMLTGRRGVDVLAGWIYLPAGALLEAAMHLYLLWVIGAPYLLVAVPIYALGWWVLPTVLDDLAPAQALLPLLHVAAFAALAVLLGFVDVGPLRTVNGWLYSLLAGVPVSL